VASSIGREDWREMPKAQANRRKSAKKPSTKTATSSVFSEGQWKVVFGELKRGRGRPSNVKSVFRAFGEKLPKEALDDVEKAIIDQELSREGVYFAHDSLGCARYAGRGSVFSRLRSHFRSHPDELLYFSFYLIADKQHEREIETALIRVASHLLVFNKRKKRDDIEPGDVRDYEPGTLYFERQRKRGRRKKDSTQHKQGRRKKASPRRKRRSRK
jgi:hypothetical protein